MLMFQKKVHKIQLVLICGYAFKKFQVFFTTLDVPELAYMMGVSCRRRNFLVVI